MNSTDALPRPSDQYMRDCQWIEDHIDALVNAHGNGWIAVHNGRVLAADPDLTVVTEKAESCGPPGDIVYQFIDDGTLIF